MELLGFRTIPKQIGRKNINNAMEDVKHADKQLRPVLLKAMKKQSLSLTTSQIINP